MTFKKSESSARISSSHTLAALLPPRREVLQTESGKRRALVVNTITEDQTGSDEGVADVKNMLRFLDTYDFESTYLGPEHDKNPRRTGIPLILKAKTDPWRDWLRNQAKEMNPGDTLVVYITGHGDGNFVVGGDGLIPRTFLRDELAKFKPCVDIIVIISACNSGSFIGPLKDVADLTMTASDETSSTYFDLDFITVILGGLMAIDLNPLDEGGEYTSSFIAGWEEIMEDPALMEKVEGRVKNEDITYMQALCSESYKEGKIYDMGIRFLSSPQESFGSAKTGCEAQTFISDPELSPTPTFTPTPTSTPTTSPTPTPTPTPTQKFVSTLDYLGDYYVSMTVDQDDDKHKEHINMADYLTLTLKQGSVRIEGPFPWVPVSGELSPEGSIDASGRGTVAGYSNIKVTFLGSVSNGHLEGSYTMGVNGGLPGGKPIVYGVSGDRLEPTPTPTSDPRIGELQDFFNDYNAKFQAADGDGLLALLHPAVLDLYGSDACQVYLSSAVEKPIEIEVLQVLSVGPWTWEIDGHSTLIEDTYSIQAGVSAGGQTIQQSMHLGLAEDGTITWFTDCGEPLP
ncbi:MAG: C13 family peptidase [Anaerolineales bacterium]